MGKLRKELYHDSRAEAEADQIGARFMDSTDVVGDMSRTFGHDFSGVNIHADAVGAQRVAGTGVDAIAEGNDIYFGSGYRRGDPVSNGLLAHELTHTMQQGVGGGMGAQVSSPMGAAQGGMFDWFKKIFGKKKPKISGPTDVKVNQSADSKAYMDALRSSGVSVGRGAETVQNRIPQARPGNLGTQGDLEQVYEAMNGKVGEDGTRSEGTIAAADKAYQNKSELPRILVDLGIRNSGSNVGRAEGRYIGTLLGDYRTHSGGLYDSTQEYFRNLEAGGVDLQTTLDSGSRVNSKKGHGYFTGGGQDQVTSDMMKMLESYVDSDPGREYYRNVAGGMKNVKLFQDSPRELHNYMYSVLATKAGSAFVQGGQESGVKQNDAARQLGLNASRTMMLMPDLMREKREDMPASMLPLMDQYEALMAKFQRILGGGQ